jgi:hypothetical protein
MTHLADDSFGVSTAIRPIRKQVAERLPGRILHQATEQDGGVVIGFRLQRLGCFEQEACHAGGNEGELSAPEWLAR